jgi:hypothetical protein
VPVSLPARISIAENIFFPTLCGTRVPLGVAAMPRVSAVSEDVVPFTVAATPMPPPPELSPEQAQYWHGLVDAFPASRFGADDQVLLVELCRHQDLSRRINAELDGLRQQKLTGTSACDRRVRTMFMELAHIARDEARVISMLATKLRLATQSNVRKIVAERERARTAPGVTPWEQA